MEKSNDNQTEEGKSETSEHISKLKFIESHCHLHMIKLSEEKVDAIVDRNIQEGIEMMVCNSTCATDMPVVKAFAEKYNSKYGRTVIIPCYGWHPWWLLEADASWEESFRKFIDERKSNPDEIFSIGEVGLDKGRFGKKTQSDQKKFLVKQLEIASELNKPITVHCVQSHGNLYEILKEELPKFPNLKEKIILHSYSGSAEMVKPLADVGCYFSLSLDSVIEKNKAMLQALPLKRILFETDSPFIFNKDILARYPSVDVTQDTENQNITESRFIRLIVNEVARHRGKETVEELSKIVYENTLTVLKNVLKS